jgi:hypothetical protein
MSKKATHTELSSPDFNDETSSSSEDRQRRSNATTTTDSIKHYVTDVLHRQGRDAKQQADLTRTQIKIDKTDGTYPGYENISAFRQYHANAEGTTRTDAQRQGGHLTSDDETEGHTSASIDQVRKCLLRFLFRKKN